MTTLYKIRPATEQDLAFICNSWLRTYRTTSAPDDIKHWDGNTAYGQKFYEILSPVVNEIAHRAQVMLAVNPHDDFHIYGYAVTEQQLGLPVLHMLYVKRLFRRFGIGSALLVETLPETINGDLTITTFPTYSYNWMRNRYNLLYNPEFRAQL